MERYPRYMKHDEWSEKGMKNMGKMNIKWGEKAGWDMLIKAILNDYWADAPLEDWNAEKVDMVMSKLYYCWVRRCCSPDEELDNYEKTTDTDIFRSINFLNQQDGPL